MPSYCRTAWVAQSCSRHRCLTAEVCYMCTFSTLLTWRCPSGRAFGTVHISWHPDGFASSWPFRIIKTGIGPIYEIIPSIHANAWLGEVIHPPKEKTKKREGSPYMAWADNGHGHVHFWLRWKSSADWETCETCESDSFPAAAHQKAWSVSSGAQDRKFIAGSLRLINRLIMKLEIKLNVGKLFLTIWNKIFFLKLTRQTAHTSHQESINFDGRNSCYQVTGYTMSQHFFPYVTFCRFNFPVVTVLHCVIWSAHPQDQTSNCRASRNDSKRVQTKKKKKAKKKKASIYVLTLTFTSERPTIVLVFWEKARTFAQWVKAFRNGADGPLTPASRHWRKFCGATDDDTSCSDSLNDGGTSTAISLQGGAQAVGPHVREKLPWLASNVLPAEVTAPTVCATGRNGSFFVILASRVHGADETLRSRQEQQTDRARKCFQSTRKTVLERLP